MIYADNAATTKMSDKAIQTMACLLQEAWGNPSSLYVHGQKAKEVLEQAREDIASVIGRPLRKFFLPPVAAKPITRRSGQRQNSGKRRENGISSPRLLSIMPYYIHWKL